MDSTGLKPSGSVAIFSVPRGKPPTTRRVGNTTSVTLSVVRPLGSVARDAFFTPYGVCAKLRATMVWRCAGSRTSPNCGRYG